MSARVLTLGVLVSGRGSNLQAVLDACASGRLTARVAVVVSDVADAYALERARTAGVETFFLDPAAYPTRTAHQQVLAEALQARGVELVVLAGFMRLVKQPMLAAFAGRMINLHPSLLPAFPGLHAQRQALEYGAKVAGATVHFVTAGMDEGPIILQQSVPVLDGDTEETLSARILEQEHRLLPAAIQLFAEGRLRLDGRRVRILPPEW